MGFPSGYGVPPLRRMCIQPIFGIYNVPLLIFTSSGIVNDAGVPCREWNFGGFLVPLKKADHASA